MCLKEEHFQLFLKNTTTSTRKQSDEDVSKTRHITHEEEQWRIFFKNTSRESPRERVGKVAQLSVITARAR
jgi:hypothetical protein